MTEKKIKVRWTDELTDAQAQQLFDRYGPPLGDTMPPGTEWTATSWAPSWWQHPIQRVRWHLYFRTWRSWAVTQGVVPCPKIQAWTGPGLTYEELRREIDAAILLRKDDFGPES